MPGDPFDFELPTHTPLRRTAALAVRPLLTRALRLKTLSRIYAGLHTPQRPPGGDSLSDPIAFAADALAALDVATTVDAPANIPSSGPLIVVANHPHGALDGLALLSVIGRVRRDVRLLANRWLAGIPELRDGCFFVDPFERRHSTHHSLPGLRGAHLWLRHGGALVIFPAGEVAHERRTDGTVIDSPWKATVGKLAATTSASVLPVHIDGGNSRLFCAAGLVHPLLRTVLLPRELLKRRGCPLSLRLGKPLLPAGLTAQGNTADAVTARIRREVEALRIRPAVIPSAAARAPRDVVPPVEVERLAADVDCLPADAKLLTAGGLDVYCALAEQIPHVLQEIGRLRELSFRAVGEGTGAPSDLDAFDDHYLHLFLWRRQSREVVGAYRIGRADSIVASKGVHALYTRTLFRYDAALLRRLPPALELGRSFVRTEYQRDHNALLLLWRGVCGFVQRYPQYRLLFGAVSISARYSDRTRTMLRQFLELNHLHHDLAGLVESQHPYALDGREPLLSVPATIHDADALAARLERDGRGMPVLLRQYLKLNARVLGFNVDPSFGDVLDALMVVDLLDVDSRILRRYFGPAGARTFLEHHRSTPHAA
jgi:putative hemolysin